VFGSIQIHFTLICNFGINIIDSADWHQVEILFFCLEKFCLRDILLVFVISWG